MEIKFCLRREHCFGRFAVRNGCRETARRLLLHGTNPNTRSYTNTGLLMHASMHLARAGKEDLNLYARILSCIALLMDNDAKVEVTDFDEYTMRPKPKMKGNVEFRMATSTRTWLSPIFELSGVGQDIETPQNNVIIDGASQKDQFTHASHFIAHGTDFELWLDGDHSLNASSNSSLLTEDTREANHHNSDDTNDGPNAIMPWNLNPYNPASSSIFSSISANSDFQYSLSNLIKKRQIEAIGVPLDEVRNFPGSTFSAFIPQNPIELLCSSFDKFSYRSIDILTRPEVPKLLILSKQQPGNQTMRKYVRFRSLLRSKARSSSQSSEATMPSELEALEHVPSQEGIRTSLDAMSMSLGNHESLLTRETLVPMGVSCRTEQEILRHIEAMLTEYWQHRWEWEWEGEGEPVL